MFSFLSMANDYENRVVANTEINGATIDTAAVTDSSQPYETGITHPSYKNGEWIIVELYSSKEKAKGGHEKWVKLFTESLPKELEDVSTCEIAQLWDEVQPDRNKIFKAE